MRLRCCFKFLIVLVWLAFSIPLVKADDGLSKTQSSMSQIEPSVSFLGEFYYERVGYYMENAGDVNGDGYEDFLIGTFHNRENGYDAGAVYLILGHSENVWGLNRRLREADARFLGKYEYDAFGFYVSGNGDVNGDGYDDFVIGAPAGNELGGPKPGHAFLFFGRPDADWGDACIARESADASFVGSHGYDHAGEAVAVVGDVNGDGYDDFIIGAPLNDDGSTESGKVYLFLGRPSGWSRDTDIEAADASFITNYYKSWAGYIVSAAGDINGDGYADFLIGSPHHDNFGGRIYLILGKATIDWGVNFDLEGADVIFDGEHAGDKAGWSLACAGDVNHDGFSDVVIGACANDLNGVQSGKVYLILGKAIGWLHNINLREADASWNGEKIDDQAGWSATGVPDLNYDGCDEILIGAWQNDHIGSNCGKTYLIYGRIGGWQNNQSLSIIPDFFIGEYAGNYAGYCVAGNDANGDGLGDLWISAPFNSENNDRAGKVYLFLSERDRYEINGRVRYYSNGNPVPKVSITISGGSTDSLLTDQNGIYSQILHHHQDYTVIPHKQKNSGFYSETILAYDAALTLQAAVGINKLDSLQKIAADADQDSEITSFDAALIARHIVGFDDSNAYVGKWFFNPNKKEYHDLKEDQFQQNYSAIIVGNVHGDWQYSDSISTLKSVAKFDLPAAIVEKNQIKIPIEIEPGINFLALELAIEYPSNQLDFHKIQKSEMVSEFQLITHQQRDRLSLVLFGAQSINQGGNLITLLFNIKDGPIGAADFKINRFQINNEPPIQGTISLLEKQNSTTPASFKLYQNFPNPFNNRTTIQLSVNENSRVNLAIYNLKGEIVKTIIDRTLVPNHYTFYWEGTDVQNHPVSSGIYVCRAVCGREDRSFKVLFIK